MSSIARAPQKPPALSPLDDRYWDARDLEAELRRAFQICHECRMCVNYCGSFPALFDRVDADIERGAEGAERIDYETIKKVGDECWQCKLCYIKCPYTPDEGASEALDFPRLMAREKAVRARRDGVALVDQILGEPQLLGAVASGPLSALSNAAPKLIAASSLLRKVQEATTGVSAEFPVPPFASETFSKWFSSRAGLSSAEAKQEIVLFATCYGEYNTPDVAKAAVQVLEHNGVRVRVPGVRPEDDEEALAVTCCGMPNLDGGDVAAAQAKIRQNVAALLPHVRKGRKVVVIGPTCGYTMKKEWAEYVPEAREVGAATVDLMELLVTMGREKRLSREFPVSLGSVAYHAACHLRAQKIGFPGARVLGVVPGTDVRVIEQCSAVDGTWGMKAKHYETGRKYAQKLVRDIREMEPDLVVSDCTLAGLRVVKENGVPVLHPAQALARAYGLDKASDGAGTGAGRAPESTA